MPTGSHSTATSATNFWRGRRLAGRKRGRPCDPRPTGLRRLEAMPSSWQNQLDRAVAGSVASQPTSTPTSPLQQGGCPAAIITVGCLINHRYSPPLAAEQEQRQRSTT